MIRMILFVVLCLLLVALGVKNSQTVSLNYLLGATQPIPVAWLISGAFAAGLVLGWLFVLPAWIRQKLELRRMRKTQDELETEISLQQKEARMEDLKTPIRSDPDEI